MIVLKPTEDKQIVYVIPRVATTKIEATIVDDITGQEVNITDIISELNGDYLKIDLFVENFVINRFYTFRLFYTVTGENIYKDKVFVTDQKINQVAKQTYSINKKQYKEVESNNDYIVI